jgi:hypothetical protein
MTIQEEMAQAMRGDAPNIPSFLIGLVELAIEKPHVTRENVLQAARDFWKEIEEQQP